MKINIYKFLYQLSDTTIEKVIANQQSANRWLFVYRLISEDVLSGIRKGYFAEEKEILEIIDRNEREIKAVFGTIKKGEEQALKKARMILARLERVEEDND